LPGSAARENNRAEEGKEKFHERRVVRKAGTQKGINFGKNISYI
jgi:hypothetical protein